jgi:hypothetical protein
MNERLGPAGMIRVEYVDVAGAADAAHHRPHAECACTGDLSEGDR